MNVFLPQKPFRDSNKLKRKGFFVDKKTAPGQGRRWKGGENENIYYMQSTKGNKTGCRHTGGYTGEAQPNYNLLLNHSIRAICVWIVTALKTLCKRTVKKKWKRGKHGYHRRFLNGIFVTNAQICPGTYKMLKKIENTVYPWRKGLVNGVLFRSINT